MKKTLLMLIISALALSLCLSSCDIIPSGGGSDSGNQSGNGNTEDNNENQDGACQHVWGDAVLEKDGYCEERIYSYSCEKCDFSETVQGSEANHSWIRDEQSPTCTEEGYSSEICEKCNKTNITTTIEATGHNFGDWETITPATCESDGEKTHSCHCGEIENEIIYGGHDMVDGVCSVCSLAYSQGLNFTSNGDGTCYVSAGSCTDSIVFIPPTSPDGETVVKVTGFSGKTMTQVIIPDSVTHIRDGAFSNCRSLQKVSFTSRSQLAVIEDGAFTNCNAINSIKLPDGVTSIGMNTFGSCINLTSINIPDGVATIGFCCFANCVKLEEISFGKGLTTIEESAFSRCLALKSVVLPEGFKTLVQHAFSQCTSLSEIYIPEGIEDIGGGVLSGTAFYNDESNWEDGVFYYNSFLLDVDTKKWGKLTIREGTTLIASYAFFECNYINAIEMPASVTKINRSAFNGCKILSQVYFKGTEEEWNSITIKLDNSILLGATITYNYIPENTEE